MAREVMPHLTTFGQTLRRVQGQPEGGRARRYAADPSTGITSAVWYFRVRGNPPAPCTRFWHAHFSGPVR